METKQIYTLKIIKDGVITIEKDYCYLNKFDFRKNSSVLFLLSAEKDKKRPDLQFIKRLKEEQLTELDTFTDGSELLQYLKPIQVKDYYGDTFRTFKLEKKI
jgi:hypothetical protein